MVLFKLCWILIVINTFTIGGGYVMLPLLYDEIVNNHNWLTNQEFIDAIAIGQLTPGPLTVMNAVIGYKVAGIPGSVLAIVSSYLPSIIIVTMVSRYYHPYRESKVVRSIMNGIKPAIVGLLSGVLISLGRTAIIDWVTAGIATLTFIIISFTRIDPSFVIIGAGILGAILL